MQGHPIGAVRSLEYLLRPTRGELRCHRHVFSVGSDGTAHRMPLLHGLGTERRVSTIPVAVTSAHETRGRDRGGRWGRPARAFGGNCEQVVPGPFPSPASDPPRSLGLSAPPRSPEPPRSHKRAPDAGCTRCEPGTRAIAATNEDAKPPWESAPAQTREPGVIRMRAGGGGVLGPDVPAGQPGGVSTSTPASSGSLAMFAFEQFGG